MATFVKIVATGIVYGLVSLHGRVSVNNNQQNGGSHLNSMSQRIVSFETQLEAFRQLGFSLNAGISTIDINRWGGVRKFEEQPFTLLYITLGQTIERKPWTPLTNRCWNFDTEAIEGNGSYISIIKNLERVTRGEIRFTDVKDYVDIAKGKAWVSFSVKGRSYKWNLKVEDDWVDTDLFPKIVELTKEINSKGRYTYFDTGGQEAVIGFETPEKLEKIRQVTGLKIDWLTQ